MHSTGSPLKKKLMATVDRRLSQNPRRCTKQKLRCLGCHEGAFFSYFQIWRRPRRRGEFTLPISRFAVVTVALLATFLNLTARQAQAAMVSGSFAAPPA